MIKALARNFFWIIPLTFYAYTACQGVGWIDSPYLAYNVHVLKLSTWVNHHNLFHLLGWIWYRVMPFDDLHYSLTLLCALFGALTVHFIFIIGFRLTNNLFASVVGALALMVSHALWWHSTILEVYTLNTALMALMVYGVVRFNESQQGRHLALACLFFGLAISNHVQMGLFVFAFLGLVLLSRLRPPLLSARLILVGMIFFLLGYSPFLAIFVREFIQRIQDTGGDFSSIPQVLFAMFDGITGGSFKQHMFQELSPDLKWRWRQNYFFLLMMNYPSVFLIFGTLGFGILCRLKRFRLTAIFVLFGFIVQLFWSANYFIWDMFAFALPVWVLFGLFAILGLDFVLKRGGAWRWAARLLIPSLVVGPWLYAQIPHWAERPRFWKDYFFMFHIVENIWDAPTYFANPNKRGYSAVESIKGPLFATIPEGAHILDSDAKGHYPFGLYYQQVKGERPDLHYLSVFGPRLTHEQAQLVAREIFNLLSSGEAVYIASPHWPERMVLNELYLILNAGQSPFQPDILPFEELMIANDEYFFEKIPLSPDQKFYIYRIHANKHKG